MLANISDYIEHHARYRPDLDCLVDEKTCLTYAEANGVVERIAARFVSLGILKGDRILILGKNSINQILVYLACSRVGVVPVGINFRLMQQEINFIAEDSGATYLFADHEFLSAREGRIAEMPAVSLSEGSEDYVTLSDWIEGFSDLDSAVLAEISSSDAMVHMYTSGTTGNPKGVILSHNNVVNMTLQSHLMTGEIPHFGDRFLLVAPAYHAAGLLSIFCCFVYGQTIVVQHEFDPVKFIKTLANERISYVTVVPVMLQFALDLVPNIEQFSFPDLKQITYGASPITENLLRRAINVFGCKFNQGYGQTESTATITMLTDEDHKQGLKDNPQLLRSCGRPVLGTEVRIVDSDGNGMPPGKVGQIIAKGAQVMQQYWHLPEATASTVVDGWLYTGDAGYLDEKGYLYIQDRIKDVIISGGENIYPAEIENTLIAHSLINDIAIIGVPDKKWGEVPLAVIVPAKDISETIDVDGITAFCNSKLAAFKTPKHVELVKELPRNLSGKVLKKELRDLYCIKYSAQ